MSFTHEVEGMICVPQRANYGPTPISEEGRWSKAKVEKDISAFNHGVGWFVLQQGVCIKLLAFILLCFILFLFDTTKLYAQRSGTTDTILIKGNTATISLPKKEPQTTKIVKTETSEENIESIQQVEAVIKKELSDYVIEMQNQKFISDNVVSEVKLDIVYGNKPDLKVVFSYSLVDNELKMQTDDFGMGNYRIESSNAIQVMMAVMKSTIENGQLRKYFTPNKEVIITINGNADATPLRNVITYRGEYGNSITENCDVDGSIQEMNISTTTGITNNSSLAFMRSYAVRYFINQQIKPLIETRNSFIHSASVSKYQGGKFRRVFIELLVRNAFENSKTE